MTIKEFAKLVEEHQIARLHKMDLACDANIANARTRIVPGRKYTKVDVGTSGKYMIDKDGNIFGIKAYGVIHRGHYCGTLETAHERDWGW